MKSPNQSRFVVEALEQRILLSAVPIDGGWSEGEDPPLEQSSLVLDLWDNDSVSESGGGDDDLFAHIQPLEASEDVFMEEESSQTSPPLEDFSESRLNEIAGEVGAGNIQNTGESNFSAPFLPGLELSELPADGFDGQVIYLNFGGAGSFDYAGPVTLAGLEQSAFFVPERYLDTGLTKAAVMAAVVDGVQSIFGQAGLTFVTGADPPAGEHSVIFIGGDDAAFREFGHFYGLAEAVDVGNADRSDRAFVFSETIAEATSGADNFVNQLVAVTAHEAGRLLGYSNVPGYGGDGPLAAVASEGAGAAMVPGTDGPERPLLVLPGIAGTFAAPGFETQWFTDRGMGPEGLEIDPLAGFYNDVLVTMQDAAGYTLGLDLFAATYDWRMEPGPAPTDAADFDGVVTGLTAESLTDGVYRYGVDYMGYWMEQAVLAWTEAHGVAPDGVDVIAHSTGGLVARTYIQSTAYNESNGEIVLPEINNLILVGVPNRGASKAWNPLNDNFGGDPAYRTVLSKAMDVAYNDYYLRGITITGADGDLSFDPDDPGAVPLTQLEFIDAYVPTIRALLATYDFLIPEGGTLDDLMSVNDDADQRNRWLLHLNDGLDLDYTLEDFQTGAPAADGRDPHRFIDIIQGQALIIYSEGDDDGFKTALYAEQFTGPNSPTDEVVPFNRFYGGPPAADQVWYVDIKEAFGGDGTVPFMSAAGQFQNDPLNRFADGSAGTGGSAQGYWFNVTDPNTDAEGAPIASSISHTGIMLNIESQTAMLNFLGVAYDPTKISTNQAYTVIDSLVRVIRHGILTPSEILADANLGDLGVDGLNALLRAGFDETVARVEALVPGEFLQSALGFLPVPEVLPDEFDLNDYIRMPNWLNAIFDPVFQFLENDPEATTEQLATLLRNLEVDLGGAEFRVDEDRVLAGVLTDDAQLLAALGGSGSPEIGEALNELFVRVPFVVEQTIQLPVDFGREVERLGIRIDDSLSLEALARFSIELSFGYDLREGLESDERFFLRTPGMQLELEIAVDDISADLNLGIIRSSIEGGSFALGTTLSYALRSPSDNPRGNVTQADLRDHAAADLFALRNEGYLDVNLPIAMPEILLDNPSPGLMAFGLSSDSSSLPTLRISNPDIYQFPDQIELDNFGSLSDFLALTPSVLEDVLDQLGERLGALAVLGDLGERLPFADGVSFWEAIDFGQVIVEDFVQPLRGEDGLLRFKDLDSFIALAADLLGMDPADIGGQYLAGEQELHFTFDFSKVIDLGNQAFAFDESFGPLELGLAGGGFSLSGEAGLTLSLVVDLDLPITVVASENALPVDGQTVDQLIFGLSVFGGEWMTVEVASSVGNSTPEDLVADINAALFAAGLLGRVQAKVGEEDQLVFETRLPSAFPSLGVRGENAAAADLLGWDNERVRTNDPLGRVSLESATADASLQIDAGPISGSGRFGILEVTVENGTADIAVDLEIDLAPGGPVSLATLYALSRSSDPLALDGFALPEVVFGINGGLVLGPVTVNDGLVDDPAAEATIAVTLSLNESGSGPLFDIEVDFDAEFAGLERYAELALSEIYQLLIDLATTIADATGSDLLDRPIPPIDRSFNELVELAQPVLDLIAEIEAADPKTLQEFADVLVEIFFEKIEERVEDGDVDAFLARHFPGLDVEDLVDFSIANDRIEIRFHQIYEIALDASIRLDLADQVPGLENIIDLQGQSEIALTGGVLLEAAVAIDLSDPAGIVFEVLRDTGVEARLGFAAEEIAINAAVGSIGFFIRDGYARLSAEDDSDEAASIRIGLNENGETGGIAISDLMLDDFAIVFDAEVDIELPVFFPTTSVPVVDAETGEPSPIFLRGLLSDPDSFSIGGPNFDDLIAGVTDLMDSFDSGLDVFFFLLDELADGELFGLPIPLIGDQLASAANFISELRTEITTAIALVDAPAETLAEEIGDALFAALGPAGIDLLRSRDDSGAPVREDVVVSLITDAEDVVIEIKIDLPLGQTLDSGLSFDFDLGLPGLPLSLDAAGGLEAALFWEFDLVFGVHRTEGFFIETLPDEDELRLGLEVSIPDIELTGQLGFLLLTAVDNPPDAETPSGLELSLGVDFSPFAGNRVTLETLTSQGFAFVDASFDGGLDLNLAFEVGFAGASAVPVTALPSFLMDFSLSWDFDGTTRTDAQSGTFGSAPDVSFTNARIAVGTFFSDFLGPIADTINGYLGPLKPLIDILQTEIAILDAIPGVRNVLGIPDGTPIDFLALAEAWGDLPPSTRQFIDALDTIIELADMISSGGVPGRDSVLTVPLGDFGFGAIDLRQAGIVQQLTSEQLVSMGEADEAAGSLADRFAALALEGGDGAAAADAFALTSAGASGPGSFDFRLLSLENVIRIISGQAIELFEYTTPEFFFEFDFRLPIPIWTPPLVELFLRADFSARAQLTFGYDSTGFMDWQSSGELSDIFNGFYVRTGDSVPPQLTLAGTIGGGVSVTIPPVRASAEVQLGAEANFNLIGGRDDKLYFRLLADHVAEEGFAALQCYFIVDGRITASFVFTIEDFLFGRSLPGFPLTVGPATLWEFEIAGDDCLCGIAGMDDRLEAVEGGQLNNNAPAIAADIGSAPGIHIEGASISSSNDTDWYTFDVPRADNLRLNLNGPAHLSVSVYDEDLNLIRHNERNNTNKTLNLGLLAAGRYFVHIESRELEPGAYSLSITPAPSSETRVFYVNDGTVDDPTINSYYTLAPGDGTNDGLSPHRPVDSLESLLASGVTLGENDFIVIDSGTYTGTTEFSGDHSGFAIVGAPAVRYVDLPEELVVGSILTAASGTALDLSGTSGVLVDGLAFENVDVAIAASSTSGTRLTDIRIHNADTGILGVGASGIRIDGLEVTASGTAINLDGAAGAIVNDVSITGVNRMGSGIEFVNADNAVLSGITFRDLADGIQIGQSNNLDLSAVQAITVGRAIEISDALTLELANIQLEGGTEVEDEESFIPVYEGRGSTGLRLTDVEDFSLLLIVINRYETALELSGLSNGSIQGTQLRHVGTGIHAETLSELTLQGNTVEATDRGMVLTGMNNDVSLFGNSVFLVPPSEGEPISSTAVAIEIFDTSELSISSNTVFGDVEIDGVSDLFFTGNTTFGGDILMVAATGINFLDNEVNGAVSISGGGALTLRDNTVTGSVSLVAAAGSIVVVEDNSFAGLGINAGEGTLVTVSGNTFTSSGASIVVAGDSEVAVTANDATGGISVTGGELVDVLSNTVNGGGIKVADATNVTLEENTVTVGGGTEALVLDSVTNALLEANTLTGGVLGIEGSAEVLAQNNTLTDSGIRVIESTEVDLLDNSLTGGDLAFLVDQATFVLIAGNVVAGATHGIRIRGENGTPATNVMAELNNLGGAGGSTGTGVRLENTHLESVVIRDNSIDNFGSHGVDASGYGEFHRNTVSNSQVGVRFDPSVAGLWENELFDNVVGLTGTGFLGNDDHAANRHNEIRDNITGILATGDQTVAFNRVSNSTADGIVIVGDDVVVHNNVVFRNAGASILVTDAAADVSIYNNTVYSEADYAVRVEGGASDLDLRNNILWSTGGFVLSVEFGSDIGLTSDYNNLYASGTALLGEWVRTFDDLLDWQIELDLDRHSIGTTRIDPALDQPVFRDLANDDFRIAHSSESGTATTINAGDSTFAFTHEPGPDGGPNGLRVNLGAYGNTAEAALSPEAYIRVLSPNFYTDYNRDLARRVIWEFFNIAGNVALELHQAGEGKVADITTVTIGNQPPEVSEQADSIGSYFWSPGMSGISGDNDARYFIRIVPAQDAALAAQNREAFSVPQASNQYYLNDSDTTTAVLTSAPGDNRHTGLTAATPKASLLAFLENYELSADQTIFVDDGLYLHLREVVISSATSLGNNEAFTIRGPDAGTGVATFDRADARPGTHGILLDDASFVSIRNLSMIGGHEGIVARNNSTFLAIENVELTGHPSAAIRIEDGAIRATLDNVRVFDGGGVGVIVDGRLEAIRNSIFEGNAGRGLSLTDTHDAVIDNNRFTSNAGGGIFARNNVSSTLTVLGNADINAFRGNVFTDNSGDQVNVRGNILVVGNTVLRTPGNEGSGVGIRAWANTLQYNVVSGHATGIWIEQGGTAIGNRVYNNAETGIRLSGNQGRTITENVIYSNPRGIFATNTSGSNTYRNNLIYDASTAAIEHRTTNNAVFHNNTIYQEIGDGIRLVSSTGADIRNNIFDIANGTGLVLDTAGETGITSNYNLFHIAPEATLGTWNGVPRATFTDWRNASFLDANGLAADPLFVNPGGLNGFAGYTDFENDGSDSNFHLQSTAGSPRDAALAPVLSVDAGNRPLFPALSYTVDATISPAIDRGDAALDFSNEPEPNGGFVNIGAFGNTALASLSPDTYVLVKNPQGGETWPIGQSFEIRWRSHDFAGEVDIVLVQGEASAPVFTIADGISNSGSLVWTVDDTITPGTGYRVEITRTDGSGVSGESFTPFTISEAISFFYVNDNTVSVGGFTTAAGDNANDGLDPSRPKASIRAILEAYDLGEGDVILVDSGTYELTTNILLAAADSGVTIRGFINPADPDSVTIIERGSISSGNYIFEMVGASGVTFEDLTLTGAHRAIFADHGGGADITVRNVNFLFNQDAGIHIGRDNPGLIVESSYFEGSRVHNVSGRQSDGIFFNSPSAIIRNNVFVDNYNHAIQLSGSATTEIEYVIENNIISGSRTGINSNVSNALFIGNTVFESVTEGIDVRGSNSIVTASHVYDNNIGIKVASGALAIENLLVYNNGIGIFADFNGGALGNLVFDNNEGIRSRGSGSGVINLIADNEVRDNNTGIRFANRSDIIGNVVYNNGGGLRADSALGNNAQFRGTIINNIVYGNTDYALEMINTTGSPLVHNNTFIQSGAESVTIWLATGATNVDFRNNIVANDGGTALIVSSNSQPGFTADYNLYHLTSAADFVVWGEVAVPTLADWFYELGQDRNARTGDPLFVDAAEGDFRLMAGSPAFAAGDPAFAWVYEAQPSGGRIDIGAFGGTPDSTPGDAYWIEVVDPFSLSKLEQGTPFEIVFQTYGFAEIQAAQWFNGGTATYGRWLPLNSDQGTSLFTNNNTIDRSGVSNPAPESVYQQQRREGFGPGNRMDFTLDLPQGDYVIRLHMATVNSTAATVYDILIDDVVVREAFDLLAAAGGAANTAVVEEVLVSVGANGTVTIGFDVIDRYAYLGGIEVLPVIPTGLSNPTFTVEASFDGGATFAPVATGVTVDNAGVGRLMWTPDVATVGADAVLRVVSENVPEESATSAPFLIANDGNVYYINNSSTANAVHSSEIGDNANSGKTPDAPMASLRALLSAYTLSPGDIVYIDSGTYTFNTNLILDAGMSGVTIIGAYDPDNADAVTTFDRDNRSSGTSIFRFEGAADVTIEHITFTGAHRAIYTTSGGAENLTVRNASFLFNQDAGIYVDRLNSGFLVEDSYFEGSRVFNTPGRQSDAIYYNGASAVIRNNVFVDNYDTAINISGFGTVELEYLIEGNTISGSRTGINSNVSDALFTGNTVFESVTEGIDVRGSNSIVTASHVYDNNIGIKVASGALAIENLLVYNNGIGIFADFNGGALGNLVFDNNEGIRSRGSGSGVINLIADNEVRDNNTGIRFANRSDIIGNVVYNNGGGLRADSALGNNAQFRGTIINN
ncbi:MAG: LEPR-XLL domain-containing protein, partial [Puniceicoccaceae bacterium]